MPVTGARVESRSSEDDSAAVRRSAALTGMDLGLTSAEQRVFALAAEGLSVREIAEMLVLAEATIHSHLSHIYAKLGVRGRVEMLARLADDSPPHRQGYPEQPARTALLSALVVAGLVAVGSLAAGLIVPISSPAMGLILLLGSWTAWRRLPKRLRWAIAPIASAGVLLSMEAVALLLVFRAA